MTNKLPSNLPQLQNLIKRDPQSYYDEFLLQYHHYKALLELFLLDPSNESKEIEELVMFLGQLFLFNFYPFLQRYLQPHQRDVTLLLTFFAQSCHELVPPEIIEPVLRAVVDNFITERNSSEAIAVGEVCSRCPLAMSSDLLQDLTGYQKYRDKSVVMAARSLINLYRAVNPSLLARKDKGRIESNVTVRAYGELSAVDHIPDDEIQSNSNDDDDSGDDEKQSHVDQCVEELVPLSNIESLAKRRKMDKEAKLVSIRARRSDKQVYHFKKPRLNPNSSTSNREKKKAFMMVRQKKAVRNKKKRSFRQKQVSII